MANLRVTLNLTKLSGAQRIDHNGAHGTFIPDQDNNVFVTENGAAFINLVCWENQFPDKYENTHSCRVSFPKDDPRCKESPLVGNIRPMKSFRNAPQPYQQNGGSEWKQYPPKR